ncbi:hypothetical protein Q2T76_07195 [Lactobacillus sp. YT155]|uniref:hypothetical protein n=1 Tax=Lactobacillus sp. YT155 TaxID=3060955 RepID=UPI00265FD621|nr:hypothetical protein [Lactobacillus sp. YT155]MDO1605844.1 hypothetical protein [Lactobacillus sp. YT155]
MKKTLLSLFILIAGIFIGFFGNKIYQQSTVDKNNSDYTIVKGPTRKKTITYKEADKDTSFSFQNKEGQLCVVVKHNNTFMLYQLKDPNN